MNLRDEVRAQLDDRLPDVTIDRAIVDATLVSRRARTTPATDLDDVTDTDIQDDVWTIVNRAVEALRPRLAVVVTDRLVAFGDDGFDPGSLSRFYVEHAAGVPVAHLWIVIDPASGEWNPGRLIEFARSTGIKVASTSLWRSPGVDYHHTAIDHLVGQGYARIVVADTTYASDDVRVVVHRRVTR